MTPWKILLCLVALFLFPIIAHAATPVTWAPSAGATSYLLEQSADHGVTWLPLVTVLPAACLGTPIRCQANITPTVTTYVLIRFTALAAPPKVATRYGAGIWLCVSCDSPQAVSGMSVP